MTHDEILSAAKEATNNQPIYGRKEFTFSAEELQRFASIIEKRTIERCAVVCKEKANYLRMNFSVWSADGAEECAAAIRKLGEQ